MTASISCRELAALTASDSLYAVLDVRERGEFNACQIANATSLPRSQIEFRIAELVPNTKVPLAVYDDGGKRAELAAATLARFGYSDVRMLAGGLPSWEEAGYPTASGVNVPSKAFGERVRDESKISEISAEELRALQQNAADLMILDMRTPEEYGRFCIPGAINVPGGDLILWANQLKERRETNLVVNCAGRTRSIIGAAGLRRLGVERVRALKNGTMGWVLAGLELESTPNRPTAVASDASKEKAIQLALRLVEEEGISRISPTALRSLMNSVGDGVTYAIDVRSEREFASGHLPGSLNVPGGQAVQRADDFIAVRSAKIVFVSGAAARAAMTAYWYREMGFRDVSVLHGGLRAWRQSGGSWARGVTRPEPLGYAAAKTTVRSIDARELQQVKDSGAIVLDVGSSLDFESAHVPGARWISRGWIELKLPERLPDLNQAIILTCADGLHSLLAGQTIGAMGYCDVAVLSGGVRAWAGGGHRTEAGLDGCLVEPNDVVLSPSVRGTKEDMRRYLEWEVKLMGG